MTLIITLASNSMHNQNRESRSPPSKAFSGSLQMELSVTSMRHQQLFWFRVSCNFHQNFRSFDRFSLVSFLRLRSLFAPISSSSMHSKILSSKASLEFLPHNSRVCNQLKCPFSRGPLRSACLFYFLKLPAQLPSLRACPWSRNDINTSLAPRRQASI